MKNKYLLLVFLILSINACQPYGELMKIEFDELQYSYDVKYSKIDDNLDLAYIDEGQGTKTIILIHGLGSYLRAWERNIPELSKNYRCIAVDLPGYGKSSKILHPGTMEYYSDVIIKLMDNLNIKNAVLAGHSMGGQIAITASLKYSDRISELVLINTAGFERFSEGQKQWFRDVMTVDGVRLTPTQAIRQNVVSNFYDMPAEAEFMVTDRIALREAKGFDFYCYSVVRSVNGMVDQPVIDLLDKIQQKTLIIFGANDNLIPNPYLNPGFTSDIAETGAKKIKNNKLVLIENCGHFSQFEKPSEVNKKIIEFLN